VRGFTLYETLVTLVLAGLVLGVSGQILSDYGRVTRQARAHSDARELSSQGLRVLARQLREACEWTAPLVNEQSAEVRWSNYNTTPEQWLIPDVNGNWNFRLRARTPCRAWLDNGALRSTANGQLGTGLHTFLAIRRRADFMDLQATVKHTTGSYKVEATAVRMVVP